MFSTKLLNRLKVIAGAALVAVLAGCAAQSHHREGMQALERQDYATAIHALGKASALAPSDVSYRRDWLRAREDASNKLLTEAAAALAIGEVTRAERAYHDLLKFDPQNQRALSGLSRVVDLGRAEEDLAAAQQAQKEDDINRAIELTAAALRRVPAYGPAQQLKQELETQQAKQITEMPRLGNMYRKPVNLEFREASIKLVFDALSRTTGINFIFDRDVKPEQRTTVFLKQTSIDDAIDVILSTGQLEKKVLNASSVLIYPNTPAKQREYQDLMVRAFYLANVEAKQTAAMLKTVLKLKDIHVEDKPNMIVLRENPETIALAERLIRLQDLEEPEVMLEVEVLEINRTSLINAGVQWNSQLIVAPLGGSTSLPSNGTSTSTMRLSDLRSLNSDSIGISVPSATINLQKTDGDANLLANPRIRVRNREKAKVMIGDKVPVVTTTSTNNFVTENIQYLDVGLKLEVEPDIHLRDEVGLKISLEVSSLVSSVRTNNGSQAYQIGTRNFTSALRLKDGETQILAGLINDEDRVSGNRVPLLGDFPLLGRLFGSQSDSRQKTEIVLSITPRLVRNLQRQGPGAETFWSGTETTIRDRPLLLRKIVDDKLQPAPAAGKAVTPAMQFGMPASAAPDAPAISPATAPNAPKLGWTGPDSIKSGDIIGLTLKLDSADLLRAGSAQIAYSATEFEFVGLDDGGYFSQGGKGSLSKAVDTANGRISLGFDIGSGAPVSGAQPLLTLKLKARSRATDAGISLISFTPIGAQKSVGRPMLPVTHRVAVTP